MFPKLTFALLLSLQLPWLSLSQNECYYAANSRAGDAIIPCQYPGQRFSQCCQIGDLCLSDNACWNPTYNVTYLYGCTDSTYTDSFCPWKCGPQFAIAPYVGLEYCYNTTLNQWSCSHPPFNGDSIQAFGAQQCFDDSIVAFAGPSSLQPILSLPTSFGGSTVWFSEINPTSYSLAPHYTPTALSTMIASVPTAVDYVGVLVTVTTTLLAPLPFTSSSGGGKTTESSTTMFPDITKIDNAPKKTSTIESINDAQAHGRISYGGATAIAIGGIGVTLLALSVATFWRAIHKRRTLFTAWAERAADTDLDESAHLIDEGGHTKTRPVMSQPLPTQGNVDSNKSARAWTAQ